MNQSNHPTPQDLEQPGALREAEARNAEFFEIPLPQLGIAASERRLEVLDYARRFLSGCELHVIAFLIDVMRQDEEWMHPLLSCVLDEGLRRHISSLPAWFSARYPEECGAVCGRFHGLLETESERNLSE